MPSYKHSVQLTQPVKGVTIVPPPTPPAPPTFSLEEVGQREQESFKKGIEQAQNELAPQINLLRQQMAAAQQGALQNMQIRFEELSQEVYKRVPDIVFALVGRVLGDVQLDEAGIKSLVEEVLREVSSPNEVMEIRLNPADHALLEGFDAEFKSRYPKLTFVADPSLGPADVKLSSRFGIIDSTIATKLRKIEEDLKENA